ncbi:MAG: type II toxin-antitoxin system PemK/MazF family toxin [Deltaproteobacteria bacterium]|nr:type II toxin-antitoxin system PemK/MazF family toxin [Deltaproteobacteria bacterium]
MKRGSLYWVNLEPNHPPEFGKVRPGLVISNTEQNLRLSTLVILPVSSRAPEIWPLRLGFKLPKGKVSFVVIPGIRQIHQGRMLEEIGQVSEKFLGEVEEALQLYLGD